MLEWQIQEYPKTERSDGLKEWTRDKSRQEPFAESFGNLENSVKKICFFYG